MDLTTIQAIGALVGQIGLPATVGVVIILAAWNLLPVLKTYLLSKIAITNATAKNVEAATENGHYAVGGLANYGTTVPPIPK